MANIFDYIQWRGDLSLSKDEFNSIEDGLKNIIIYGNRTDEAISKLGTVRSY